MVYQPTSGWEEDAILVPTWAIGQEPLVSSWIEIPPNTQGGVLDGASLGTLGGCLAVHYLFLVWPAGEGGVWSLPWGCCGWATRGVLGKNRPMVFVCLVTISSPWSASASEELTNSAVVGSAIQAGASSSSMDTWTLRLCDTRLAKASLTSTRDSELVNRGPKSRALLTDN